MDYTKLCQALSKLGLGGIKINLSFKSKEVVWSQTSPNYSKKKFQSAKSYAAKLVIPTAILKKRKRRERKDD